MATYEDSVSGEEFRPVFDEKGLIVCITCDACTHSVLMVAYMNAESLARTVETGEMWYWSRSRAALWRKGETSGQLQRWVELRTDCDQDAILARVNVAGDGTACHTGEYSCFYRRLTGPSGRRLERADIPGQPAGNRPSCGHLAPDRAADLVPRG